jgi:hypothetical protein
MLMVLHDCLLVLNKMSYVYRRKTIACWPIFLRSKIFPGIMGGGVLEPLEPPLATPLTVIIIDINSSVTRAGHILRVGSNQNVESKIKVVEPKDPFCGVHIDALVGCSATLVL